jgi:hypothetical protein
MNSVLPTVNLVSDCVSATVLRGTRLADFETFIDWRATPKHLCFVKVSRR